ncbi:hypothetical protein [Halorussus sp. AFM4]|uniref:hypothetical protein n=1 Tax=Halorussus sp. AFM4 TaxID=3421651 RepID=UPI003EBC1F3A
MSDTGPVPAGAPNLALALLCLGLAVFAGCTAVGPQGDAPPNYYVGAHVVERPPADATVVPVSDDRIADVEPIQEAVEGAVTGNGSQVSVSKSEYDRVTDALGEAPLYENEGDRWVNSTGLYVRADGQVVRVMVYSQRPA